MNRKKRRTLLSVFMVLILLLATSCSTSTADSDQKAFSTPPKESAESRNTGGKKKSTSVEALSEVNPIPEDGIISREQFETVAGKDMQVSFVGESAGGYKYTWTYDASMIQNPQDQNLLIDFNTEDLEDIKVSANNANDALEMEMHGQGLICPPTLTVEIPEAWQSDSCVLLKEQDGQLARMSDVTIQSSPKSDDDSSESGSDAKTKEGDEKKDSQDGNTQPADVDSLTRPVAGTTTFIMTVTSIDGLCYIVGVITNQGKISQINDIAQASQNANAAAAGDGAANPGDGSGSGAGNSGSAGGAAGTSGQASGSGSGSNSGGSNSSGGKTDKSNSGGSSKSKSNSKNGGNSDGASGKTYTCTISISCSTILKNMDNLTDGKEEFVPKNGWILKKTKVKFNKGDSVHDVLQKICRDKGIHMESRYTPAYNSAYVEGINQLYEFDCGELSGWMFNVNGWFPNYGCSKYKVSDGDEINWVYTCDLGKDVGDNSMY